MTSFTLRPAMPTDIAACGAVFGDAFKHDAHTQVKTLGREPDAQSVAMVEALHGWIQAPARCSVLAAIDDTTGELVGWACWAYHGLEYGTVNAIKQEAVPETTDARQSVTRVSSRAAVPAPIAALESITNQDMQRWQAMLMPPGTRCLILVAIAVSPAQQRRGIGSALIRWGTDQADNAGVFCWVHASEAGATPLARHGFQEIGNLVVDLDSFASARPEHDTESASWGHYTFRYMKRPAVSIIG